MISSAITRGPSNATRGPLTCTGSSGTEFSEADTREHRGDAHRGAGDAAAARAVWTRALRIFDEIDHPDGDEVRAKLHLAAARHSRAVPGPDATIGRG